MGDFPPPLRVKEQDGSPNAIPVFEIIVSNGTLTDLGGGRVSLATGPGGGATGTVNAGSSGNIAYYPANGTTVDDLLIGSATTLLGVNSSGASHEYKVLSAGNNISISYPGISVLLSATTGGSTSTAGLVQSSLTISTIYPVSGGGDLSVNRTHAIDTAFLINSGRTISSTYPLAGGGNLSADRTLTVDTLFLVNTGRNISTGMGLAGGGNLSADRTLTADTSILVTTGRTISTIYPISGGGNLSLDRTFAVDTAFLVNTGRTIATGMGLSGGGDLSSDRTLVANTSILVTTGRTISTLYPISGGGDLSVNRTYAVDTSFLVTSARSISTVYPISGGGNLGLDRSFAIDTSFLVNSGRSISTIYPVSGGGNLSLDRTFAVDTLFLVNSGRLVNTGVGLIGGGNLSANITLGINTGGSTVGQMLISSGGTTLYGVAWVNTGGGGGSGTVNAGSLGNIALYPSDGTTVDDDANLHWYATSNQFVIGPLAAQTTGVTLQVSRGFPGGTQLDWNNIFGASPIVVVQNTGANDNRIIFYANTSRLSELSFCDNRTTTDGVARGYLQYDHPNDAFYISNSGGGNTTVHVRNGQVSIGNPAPNPPAGIILNAAGSSRITSVLILGAQATSTGHAVRADRLINTGAGLVGQSNLSSDITLGISTAGSTVGQVLISSGGTGLLGVAWVNTLGGSSSVVYAPTGGNYVAFAADANLTNERILTASDSITITTDSTTLWISANTGNISGKQATVTFPLIVGSGGTGASSLTNRGFLIGSGTTTVQVLAALNSGELLVGSSTVLEPQILPLSAGSQGYLLASNSASKYGVSWTNSSSLGYQAPITFALIVGSGGTGQVTLTNRGILIGSGTAAVQALAALNSGGLIVGSGTTVAPQILAMAAGSQGYVLIANSATPFGLSWTPSSGGSTTVYAATGNQYVCMANAADLTAERVLTASTGLTLTDGGADGNASLSVNTNVRDKFVGFFAAGTLSTVMLAEQTRIYVPYTMEVRDVRLTVTTTPVGANIIVDVGQFPTSVGVNSSFYAAANRPRITTGNAAGIGSGGALANTVLYAGSYLGFSVDQIGTTESGQNLTITVLLRTS